MADDLICDNTRETRFRGTADNVEVPFGADCFMADANVGNVKVFGLLFANETVFRGDIQAEPGHERVILVGTEGNFRPFHPRNATTARNHAGMIAEVDTRDRNAISANRNAAQMKIARSVRIQRTKK